MDIKANSESKEEQSKKVENTDKVMKEVTKIPEKSEEKVKEDNKNQISSPIFGSEINYII